ncbi:NAD(P)-binding protein [Massarina eburnea CBS 473.64]|uniref:NAD(P)-binding protein n=1 Tax=Massarina eburnea CBS 473.64 TaxID=1395130 RepID=A0A6A6SCK0_9PLEO|nr:NAD(P)-binding protein [Massarina eburnea CBS 473.64]
MATTDPPTVLIVGGTGFIGTHLVTAFLANPAFGTVYVLSRSKSSKSRIAGAKYFSRDLTDYTSARAIIEDIRPTLIIHCASPSPVTGTPKEYRKFNLHGTQNLLKCAKQSEHVRGFIFTSSSTLALGQQHNNVDETCELSTYDWEASPYARSKAGAELMVLHSNYPKNSDEKTWADNISTACIRLPIVYGAGDTHTIPGCLNALAKGYTTTTIGDGENYWSYCSVENAVSAHVLLANALLKPVEENIEPSHRIAGQAFNINDGTPFPFWEFPRLCWKYAGHDAAPRSEMRHLSVYYALLIAKVLEWVYWIFTLGFMRPYNLGKQQVEYMCFDHTYSIEKAKTVLKFEPKGHFEEGVEKAVQWCLDEGGWRKKLRGVKGVKQD